MEPPAPTPAPGEVELWVVAVELVLGTDAPPDVPLDVVVPGAVVAGVEVVVAATASMPPPARTAARLTTPR